MKNNKCRFFVHVTIAFFLITLYSHFYLHAPLFSAKGPDPIRNVSPVNIWVGSQEQDIASEIGRSVVTEKNNSREGHPIERSIGTMSFQSKELNRNKKVWPERILRGVNTNLVVPVMKNQTSLCGFLSHETCKTLSKWNVNVIRVSIGVDQGSDWDVKKEEKLPPIPQDDPVEPYKKHIKGLEIALDLAEQYNLFVIVTAGNIVGRKIDVFCNRGDTRSFQQELIDLWTSVARRFGHRRHLLAYDLMNEPQFKRGDDRWQRIVLPELIKKIREIDKETYVIIEPGPWGLPNGFRYLKPVNDTKVVYSFHFYFPHNYTHQGVRNRPKGLKYPGMLRHFDTSRRLYWGRDQLKKGVEVAREFQKKYGVRMFVGEFSVIRWAPGAARWLEDAISIFEEYGWDWCYHSYGGWNGWNPTFSSDDPENNKQDGGKETDRLKVLTKAWSKNQSKNLQPEIEINRNDTT